MPRKSLVVYLCLFCSCSVLPLFSSVELFFGFCGVIISFDFIVSFYKTFSFSAKQLKNKSPHDVGLFTIISSASNSFSILSKKRFIYICCTVSCNIVKDSLSIWSFILFVYSWNGSQEFHFEKVLLHCRCCQPSCS